MKTGIPIEIKGDSWTENAVHKVFATSNQLLQTHYAPGEYIEEVNKSLGELDKMLPYLDEITYFACKEVLENGLELGKHYKPKINGDGISRRSVIT